MPEPQVCLPIWWTCHFIQHYSSIDKLYEVLKVVRVVPGKPFSWATKAAKKKASQWVFVSERTWEWAKAATTRADAAGTVEEQWLLSPPVIFSKCEARDVFVVHGHGWPESRVLSTVVGRGDKPSGIHKMMTGRWLEIVSIWIPMGSDMVGWMDGQAMFTFRDSFIISRSN